MFIWTKFVAASNITDDDARKFASWVLSVFSNRSAKVMVPLFKTMVRSRAEYNCPVWNPSKIEDIKTVESIQRSFTSKIEEVKDLSYWERIKTLNIMSLQRRRERYIIIHVFKILNHLAPNDIGMNFYQNERLGLMSKILSISKKAKQKFQKLYDESFHVTGAKLWNKIPKEVKLKKSLDSFNNALSKFMMSFPDQPPIHGLSSRNSLLEISLMNKYRGAVDDSEEDCF